MYAVLVRLRGVKNGLADVLFQLFMNQPACSSFILMIDVFNFRPFIEMNRTAIVM